MDLSNVLVSKDFMLYVLSNPSEVRYFNRLIMEYHYLHSLPKGGRTIKVVAECNVCHRWFALIEFRSPPLGTILWLKKLGYHIDDQSRVLVNTRFLILTSYQLTNSCHRDIRGSRILSKTLKLIKQLDKDVKYIVSYVDVNRGYLGTVYKAANFRLIGLSEGINMKHPFKSRSRSWVIEKVPKKLVYIYVLR